MAGQGKKRRWSPVKVGVISLVFVVALAGAWLGAYFYLHSLQESELREALVVNCEKSGNPLREVLQNRIDREIEQTENLELLEKFFPQISQADLEEFASKSTHELEQERREVAPVDCARKYPH